jgi:hypothetical protein
MVDAAGLLRRSVENDNAAMETEPRHLKGLTKLQDVYLENTQVTGAGLEYLKGLTQLQTLDMKSTQMTDIGLEHLEGLTRLQSCT